MAEKLILSRRPLAGDAPHVSRRAPLEACGLLAGKNNRVEIRLGIRNAERVRCASGWSRRAQWRAFQRIEAAGLDLLGIYHSHPNGPDHPSPTDIAEALYPVAQIIWFRVDGRWQGARLSDRGRKVAEITWSYPKA